ncbi:MAG: hypothetical protein JW880_06295 [Candidatus Thermoplasmatota archaeon]|nr:hypothetical protein [Candidatus Thermoplasmatota archaeon]
MEALLALLIALVAFALIIFLISRSVKLIMLIGIAFVVVLAIKELGIVRL